VNAGSLRFDAGLFRTARQRRQHLARADMVSFMDKYLLDTTDLRGRHVRRSSLDIANG
jgi:hypothetical protein